MSGKKMYLIATKAIFGINQGLAKMRTLKVVLNI
jgi:hypothetical protein